MRPGGRAAPAAPVGRARAGRLALLAACLALAVPAALAAPHFDGSGANAGSWLYHLGSDGQMAPPPAYAQVATDAALILDAANSALIVAPNQINITYTKNATAGPLDYAVYTDFNDDVSADSGKRNVTSVAGNGTLVHTLTFDGDGLKKRTSYTDYHYYGSDALTMVLIGNVTNSTGTSWSWWEDDWSDPVNSVSYTEPEDGQRPAVVSARLTGPSQITVEYDEPVLFGQLTDYAVMLDNGTIVSITSATDGGGHAIVPGSRAHANSTHKLLLDAPVTLGDIEHLKIASSNITDRSAKVVGWAEVQNTLLDENSTVVVKEGQPPRPLSAAITGPLEITIMFDEPAYASPADYIDITVESQFLSLDNRSRTVVEVDGSGTATHVLTLDKPGSPIPLYAGAYTSGLLFADGVSDDLGNVLYNELIAFTDNRTLAGLPHLIAAKFTGPNEITVSYNNSAAIPANGYSVLAHHPSLRNATSGPDVVDKKLNFTVALDDGTTTMPAYNYTRMDVASVSGNRTATHTLALEGDGVKADAVGLINITGLEQLDGTPVANYADAIVHDEQLLQITSAWAKQDKNTAFVEYGEPATGRLSGYPAATVSGQYGNDTIAERRAVASVATGTHALIEDAPELIAVNLAKDDDYFKRAAMLANNTHVGGSITSGTITAGMLYRGTFNGSAVSGSITNGTVAGGTVVNAAISSGSLTDAYIDGALVRNATLVAGNTTHINITITGADIDDADITGATIDGGNTIRYVADGASPPQPTANVRHINGTFAVSEVFFDRPTPWTVIAAEAPSLLNPVASATTVGYTGELVLLNGISTDVRVVPGTVRIQGYHHAYESGAVVKTTYTVSDRAWLVTRASDSLAAPPQYDSTLRYNNATLSNSAPLWASSLDGTPYFKPYEIETAEGCMRPQTGAAPTACATYEGGTGRPYGPLHMITLEGTSMNITEFQRAVLTIGHGVRGANDNPLEEIGITYTLPPDTPSDEPYYWQHYRQGQRNSTVDIVLPDRGLVDFTTNRPQGYNIPASNPSIHINETDVVLQMRFNEPVDAERSVDPTKIKIGFTNPILSGIQTDLYGYLHRDNVTFVTDRLLTIKLSDINLYIPQDVLRTNGTSFVGSELDRLALKWMGRELYNPIGIELPLHILIGANLAGTVKVVLEDGFAYSVDGRKIGGGTYNAYESPLPAPAAVTGIAMTGNNTFAVSYSDPLYAAYYGLELETGGGHNVTAVAGNGTRQHNVTFNGPPVPPAAGGAVMIAGIDGTQGVLIRSEDSSTVRVFSGKGTGYVPELKRYDIGPQRPDAAARDGGGAVSVSEAGITSGNEITVRYTGPVVAPAASYTRLMLDPGGPRDVTGVAGSGTAVHVITFDGPPAGGDAVGTIDIAALVGPGGYARFPGASGQALADMQRPLWALTVGDPVIFSTGRQLVVTYGGPVDATPADYSITRATDGSEVEITEMRGNASVHVLDHRPLANKTLVWVAISPLDDEGSGYTYRGTGAGQVVVSTDWSKVSPFPTPSEGIASLDSWSSDGDRLTLTYSNPVNATADDYEIGRWDNYAITNFDRAAVEIISLTGNDTAVHTLDHANLPNGTYIRVVISPLDDEGSGYVYPGKRIEMWTTGGDPDTPPTDGDPDTPPTDGDPDTPPTDGDPDTPPVGGDQPATAATASAVFTGKNAVRITYSAPLAAPANHSGPVYGAITPDGGAQAMPVSGGVSGLGTAVHTVVFGGDGVTINQTGTIALNTDLVGRVDGMLHAFTDDTIAVRAGTFARTAMPTGQMPVVAIEEDSFVRVVNVVDGGDAVRPTIDLTSLAVGALVEGSESNTVTLPSSGGSTRIIASFAEVSFPPGVTAMSVPADGLLELYVSAERPPVDEVAAALNVTATGLEVRKVIEVGDNETHIVFDRPVRILLDGQADGRAFYVNNTDGMVVPIGAACVGDDTAMVHAQLGGAGECALDVGGDKVIYTYHLTLFGTARTATPLESMVSAAPPGSIVKVPAGTYGADILRVNKSLTIEPANPDDPPLFTNHTRIIVTASEGAVAANATAGGQVVIRGLTFADTEHTSGGDGLASIIVTSKASSPGAATLRVAIEGNTFRNTCDTAIRAAADAGAPPISGLAVKNNLFYDIGGNSAGCTLSPNAPDRADAIVAGRHGPFTAGSVQLANMTVQGNYIFNTTYTGMRIAGADGLVVSGNHIEGVPDDGIRILPSRNVQVHLNTVIGANSAPRATATAHDGAAGAAIEVWSGSDDVAVTLNRISGSAGAFSVCAGTCDPGADAADGTGGNPVPVGRAMVNSAGGLNDMRFSHNVLAKSNTGVLVANNAGGMLNARANYYPGYAASAADRIASAAGASVSHAPALDDAGPVRIGAIVADGAGSSLRSIDSAVRAAFELGVLDFNARQAEVGGFVGLEPEARTVPSPNLASAADHASAIADLRSGASADQRMLPVLHNSIASAMALYDRDPQGALAGISAMASTYGHYPFVNDRDGTIVAHGANASLVGDTATVRALAGGTDESVDALFDFATAAGGAAMGVAPGYPDAPWKWWAYEFADPATGETVSKRSVLALHPGPDGVMHSDDDLVFGAGYYPGPGAAHLVVAAGDAPAAVNSSDGMVAVSPASTAAQLAMPDTMFRLAPPDSKLAGVVLEQAGAGQSGRATVVALNDSASLQSMGLAGELAKIADQGALPDGVSGVRVVSYNSSLDGWGPGAASSIRAALSQAGSVAVYAGRADAFAALASAFAAQPPSGTQWYATGELARADLAASGQAAVDLARAVDLTALLQHAAPNAAIDAALALPHVGIAIDESTRGPAYAAYDAPGLLGRAVSSMPGVQGTPADIARAIGEDIARTHAGALGTPLILDRNGDLVLPIEYAVSSFPASGDGSGAWEQLPRRIGELTCGITLEKRVLDFGSLAPGQRSRAVTQTVTNSGTLPYQSVTMSPTAWTYAGTTESLPASITEVRELGRAADFADLGGDMTIAPGLGPGMDRNVQFRIDLTGIQTLPVGQVSQTVNYLVYCNDGA